MITEVVVTALIISLIMATLRKLYDWLCSFFAKSNIPMPPAYPLLRHLPYFWEGMNEDRVLMQWAEQFKKEGIFKFDPLLGRYLGIYATSDWYLYPDTRHSLVHRWS